MAKAYERMAERARSELPAAKNLLENGFVLQAVFHCQQAIELLLKAIYMRRHQKLAPRIHDLLRLAAQVPLDVPAQYEDLLDRLTVLYTRSRYEVVPGPAVEPNEVDELLRRTEEVVRWLETFLR